MVDVFSQSVQQRFWSKVIKQDSERGHWFWIGAIADDGYGRLSINARGRTDSVRPHRFAYALAHGRELNTLGPLMHTCDIPICVRATTDELTHLVEGTVLDNMLDRRQKGRASNGQQFAWRGLPRQRFTEKSRALRDELTTHGTTRPDVLAALITGNDPEAPTLF
ncbi:hypothetical protein ACFUOZ_19550 [Paenarthrobacter sp. NPDC057355]|uniref:hypothetical protein n=1 Tax=Paenarthrobacter sp. NPDC057355 TaxID=3346105 RepID=UPI0036405A98